VVSAPDLTRMASDAQMQQLLVRWCRGILGALAVYCT
jgi:hypothetical protein